MLKKAFQLTPNMAETQELADLNNEIQVDSFFFMAAKKELKKTLMRRNSRIKQILYERFGYIVKDDDKVVLQDFLNKIMIYEEKDPLKNDQYKELE